jgi:hypothetical protein
MPYGVAMERRIQTRSLITYKIALWFRCQG